MYCCHQPFPSHSLLHSHCLSLSTSAEQFASLATLPTADQLLLHVWHDCTLHHLITLLHTHPTTPLTPPTHPLTATTTTTTTLSFALVYPDRTGRHVLRQVAVVRCGEESGEEDEVGQRTLRELKLEIGDYMDVAVTSVSVSGATQQQLRGDSTAADTAG